MDADVCVVGSGFAGTFLALRLLDRGASVALLEAGGFLKPEDAAEGDVSSLPLEEDSDSGFRFDDTRTIGVGGTSRRWNGVASRLIPADFRSRTLYERLVDWPIDYDQLEPYYCEAEAALGVAGEAPAASSQFPRSCRYPYVVQPSGLPETLLSEEKVYFERVPFTMKAKRYSPTRLAESEIPRFTANPRARLLAGHRCIRIELDGSGYARCAVVVSANGMTSTLRARHFVLAAGVAEIPRILFASRSTPQSVAPGNESGLLGAFLVAHPRLRTRIDNLKAAELFAGLHRTYSLAESFRRADLLGAHFDLFMHKGQVTIDAMTEQEPRVLNRLEPKYRSESEVCGLRVRFELSELDRRTMERATGVQQRLTSALSEAGRASGLVERTWFHPAGTCRMSADPMQGVVNADGLVFGTKNLFAVGAATFPTSGSGNPTLTIVALAMRLGDHVARRLALD